MLCNVFVVSGYLCVVLCNCTRSIILLVPGYKIMHSVLYHSFCTLLCWIIKENSTTPPYIFNSSEDDEDMQLNSLFPEDYEGDEQDNQPRDRSDSASARGNSDSGRQNDEDSATRAQSPHPMSQQNRSKREGGSKKPRKCRHRKRHCLYAKNVTVSVGMIVLYSIIIINLKVRIELICDHCQTWGGYMVAILAGCMIGRLSI